ncbi:hypothetical protein F4809DRAFT_641963 [Biscogniauxia mediterranea]|nr:hypothetical protein F4809DRAFT_641963 [Biscogniauxia mediterranea]
MAQRKPYLIPEMGHIRFSFNHARASSFSGYLCMTAMILLNGPSFWGLAHTAAGSLNPTGPPWNSVPS